jgi:Tfp pilus assembly major pilin PilA
MIVIGIIGTRAAIALPNVIACRVRAKVATAVSEIKNIEKAIYAFLADNGRLPADLSEVEGVPAADPWGNP